MKSKLLAVVLACALGALPAYSAGYFVGAEIVPHTFSTATYGIPYLLIGYDAGWGFANIGFSNPGVPNTWVYVGGGGLYGLSSQTYIGGGVTFWLKLYNFAISDHTWSVNFRGLYKFDSNIAVFLTFHIPLAVSPDAFLFGSWLSFGITYYIWQGAPTK